MPAQTCRMSPGLLFPGRQSLEPIWKPPLKKMKNIPYREARDLGANPHSVTLSQVPWASVFTNRRGRLGRWFLKSLQVLTGSTVTMQGDSVSFLHQGWLATKIGDRKELEPQQQALGKSVTWNRLSSSVKVWSGPQNSHWGLSHHSERPPQHTLLNFLSSVRFWRTRHRGRYCEAH